MSLISKYGGVKEFYYIHSCYIKTEYFDFGDESYTIRYYDNVIVVERIFRDNEGFIYSVENIEL